MQQKLTMLVIFSLSWWSCLYLHSACPWRWSEWVWTCKREVDSCSHGNVNMKRPRDFCRRIICSQFKYLLLVGGNYFAEHNLNAIKPEWRVSCKYWCSCKWIVTRVSSYVLMLSMKAHILVLMRELYILMLCNKCIRLLMHVTGTFLTSKCKTNKYIETTHTIFNYANFRIYRSQVKMYACSWR
mgnify:FL=1